eukprot:GHVS01064185.1.p1 GENE.GHVS01064185.1~~GHVS01064185.1.p1  ORF type:complete len:106 (-),score=45.16 GHVS01064185.1:98-415(-)
MTPCSSSPSSSSLPSSSSSPSSSSVTSSFSFPSSLPSSSSCFPSSSSNRLNSVVPASFKHWLSSSCLSMLSFPSFRNCQKKALLFRDFCSYCMFLLSHYRRQLLL